MSDLSRMRITRRASRALVVLAALVTAEAAGALGLGRVVTQDCALPETRADGELFVVKTTPSSADGSDLVFDTRARGEAASDPGSELVPEDGSWRVEDAWRVPMQPGDSRFSIVTYADGLIALDSEADAVVDFGATPAQRVGNSLPVGVAAGTGLRIPGTRSRYAVSWPTFSEWFPQRASDGRVRLAFAPLAEVYAVDLVPGACTIAGSVPDAADLVPTDSPPVAGHVIGYNVYRIPACRDSEGTAAEFGLALVDADPSTGWIGFVDLRRFRLSVSYTPHGAPGPNDLDPFDEVELTNSDGIMYSGDEVVLFTDLPAASRPDPWRAPMPDQDYWYAVQPVWRGRIDEFADVGFTADELLTGDHRRDLDGDGEWDAVDLHLGVTTPEFISPQAAPANGSIDGLGLTQGGLPLLSRPMFAARILAGPTQPECPLTLRTPRLPVPRPGARELPRHVARPR